MTANQLRSRTVGCKMTEAECERLNATAEERGVTLGEWCREVLLQHTNGTKPITVEEAVLAELLALRTILLNAFYKLAQGEHLTAEEMQRLIEHADEGKFRKAQERLKAGAQLSQRVSRIRRPHGRCISAADCAPILASKLAATRC